MFEKAMIDHLILFFSVISSNETVIKTEINNLTISGSASGVVGTKNDRASSKRNFFVKTILLTALEKRMNDSVTSFFLYYYYGIKKKIDKKRII